ncbi:MAG: class II aldolase [Streptococcus sp.]|nr:class II aldolase [Streptococcus sp.]
MELVNGYKLMEYAKDKKIVLPAFNTTNFELTKSIIAGFNSMELGGYIEISSNNLTLSSPEIIADMVKFCMKGTTTPIALHLDHGKSFEDVKACIEAGFTSIMIDASHLPFEENVKEVQRVVEYCHYFNIPVEAELGAISGKEDDHVVEGGGKTNPDDVREFVELTKCDTLAVSVGNVHGMAIAPKLDFKLLEKINQLSKVPLVLHGGSGIPFEQIRKAKQFDLIKVNFGADLRQAYIKTFGKAYELDHNSFDMFALSKDAVMSVEDRVKTIISEVNIK